MDISRSIYERKPQNTLVATIQKVALYTVIPFMFIAALEAIVKNMIFVNLINCAIAVLNAGHSLCIQCFGGYEPISKF